MMERESYGIDSSAVQKHLDIMQGVIGRMAENSRSCKVWCVTLVSAVLVLAARTEKPGHGLIALAPTTLLYLLDAYYLALERRFRASYTTFVGKLHSGGLVPSDIYSVQPTGPAWRGLLRALFGSIAVAPFYFVVLATIILIWLLIL